MQVGFGSGFYHSDLPDPAENWTGSATLTDLHDDGGEVGASAGVAGQLYPVQVDAVPQLLVQSEFPEPVWNKIQ